MAHAIFNVSPVKFLSSIQDHIHTTTPYLKNKTYRNTENQTNRRSPLDEQRNSSASPVTLQLTLPTETVEQQMVEIQQAEHLSSVPIDIPRPYPLNVPMSHRESEYEGLMPNNLLSTSFNSHHSSYAQDNNLVALANSVPNMGQSPYLPTDDLTVCFDGLAVRSPTNSYYSNHNGLYSPQQINSPANMGSPHAAGSPLYFGSPQSANYNQFLSGSPYNNSQFVGSPNSPHFLGSPAITPFMGDSSFDPTLQQQPDFSSSYGLAYLSPSLSTSTAQQHQQRFSPINSPSPTGSYGGSNYLFPPSLATRPSSPVPDDVILTASELNDYMNSPYLSASVGSNNPSPTPTVQPLSINTDISSFENPLSEFFMNQNMADDCNIELFPSVVQQSSPHAQPRSCEEGEEEEEEDLYKRKSSFTKTTTPSGRRAKIHQCPHCAHTSNRANNMREHVQIHNPNRPKPHACKLCNRAFARKHDMNRHYNSCKKQHHKSSRYMVSPPPLIPHT